MGVFLIAGPGQDSMLYWQSKVGCITTDGGTEIHMVEVVDIMLAFIAWLHGTPLLDCAPLVNHARRLFYNSIRISGWGHGWGNLTKRVANACPKWTPMLDNMRLMV